MARLIPVETIPDSLWSREEFALYLPSHLISSWEILLDKYQLRERAMTKAPSGFEGGMSKEDTDNHLAWRFTGSCARIMLAMLDPLEELHQISDVFARIFSGNKVFLADLPCGSGATSISILSVFCELRKQDRIPRMPLHIVVVGGEISEYARHYAKEIFESLKPEFESQAITVEFETMNWNVCDKISNTDLITKLILQSQNCLAKLLVVSNFSGLLEREKKWNEAQDQLEELFRYSRGDNSVVLWVEPEKNNVTKNGGFFSRLAKWLRQSLFKVTNKDTENQQDNHNCSSINVKHPLKGGTFRTKLAVIQFELPLRG